MNSVGKKIVLVLALGLAAAAVVGAVVRRVRQGAEASRASERLAAPVEVAPIERGEIVHRRTFSGALEATAEFVVASRVNGRIETVDVDLADPVQRGTMLVALDDDEHQQAVQQALADLEVARANANEATSSLSIAERELVRIEQLHGRGIASESQLDANRAAVQEGKARLAVARAQITRAESSLEAARIRLSYTRITADWAGGDDERFVSRRWIDPGDTVSANEALLTIVELDPVTGVFRVSERDYVLLRPGQAVRLTTQAYGERRFEGRIARIAPVFSETSRQARVELTIPNPEQLLKPGMFVRATVELERLADATIVPEAALTDRDRETGVFVVAEDGRTVAWRPVEVVIRDGDRVAVRGTGLEGRVVTLGQQLIDDGSAIVIPGDTQGRVVVPGSGQSGAAPL